jgi:phage antirepressor YoqD-like protein
MLQWLRDNGVLTILAVLAVLTGLSAALGMIKDKTASQADNKAYAVISWIAKWLQKLADLLSGNLEH